MKNGFITIKWRCSSKTRSLVKAMVPTCPIEPPIFILIVAIFVIEILDAQIPLPQGGAAIPPQVLPGAGIPPAPPQPGPGQRDIRPQDAANIFTGTGNSLYFGG